MKYCFLTIPQDDSVITDWGIKIDRGIFPYTGFEKEGLFKITHENGMNTYVYDTGIYAQYDVDLEEIPEDFMESYRKYSYDPEKGLYVYAHWIEPGPPAKTTDQKVDQAIADLAYLAVVTGVDLGDTR